MMSILRTARWAFGVASAAFLGFCFVPAERTVEPPNLIVLVIDALRVGHVGAYGYERPTTPELDRLAARAAVFENASSAANYTTASVPSMFTGFLPTAHGVFAEGDRLDDGFVTLAERLSAAGYSAAAFAPNPSLGRRFNFDQGFDLYDDKALRNEETVKWRHFETAERIQRAALAFLDRSPADRPVFLYLHYRDVHGPYVPPPPYDTFFVDDAVRSAPALDPASARALPEYLRLDDAPQTLAHYVAQYDGGIRYTDGKIAEFLSELERRGRLANAWIVVTADHGESFLEHGAWNHGNELFQEEIHVPLILLSPDGRGSGRRIADVVSGIDLYPTLLAAAGLRVDETGPARNLLPLLEGGAGEVRAVCSEGPRKLAVRREGWKLMRSADERRWRLFDLVSDPGERIDRAAERPDRVTELEAEGRRCLADARRQAVGRAPSRVEIGTELERELRALGYLR
jgi:arylsulfatase